MASPRSHLWKRRTDVEWSISAGAAVTLKLGKTDPPPAIHVPTIISRAETAAPA